MRLSGRVCGPWDTLRCKWDLLIGLTLGVTEGQGGPGGDLGPHSQLGSHGEPCPCQHEAGQSSAPASQPAASSPERGADASSRWR